MLAPKPNCKQRTNEDIFFEYYPRLLEWSFQLTRRDRSEATDLVHDLYVQFTRSRSLLDEVEEIEPYLFNTLRNLNYSKLRRAGKSPIDNLSIVDYDSIERGLAAVDRRDLLFVRTDLKQLCEYVSQRKATSRSANILILRFFLGYYSSEVMKVAMMSRAAVDKCLQIARREARLHLERPGALHCIAPGATPPEITWSMTDDAHDLFIELRRAIFSTRTGDCFDQRAIAERYRAEQPEEFTVPELAHLVSCKICLDYANATLGLPLLEERSPVDSLDRDNPQDPGACGGSNNGSKSKSTVRKTKKTSNHVAVFKQKAREAFEHRPRSLQLAVNGDIRASQAVTSEMSELSLKLNLAEMPTFIEVLSEQGVGMAYLEVANPATRDDLEQFVDVALSDGRDLKLVLSFATDVATIHVIYRDPIMVEEVAVIEGFVNPPAARAKPSLEDPELRPEPTFVALISKWWSWFREKFFDGPVGYAAILASLSLVAMFFFWSRDQVLSPAKLLRRAAIGEAAVPVGQAVHRVLELTVESETEGASISERVEVWRDPGSGRTARRLYDANGRLEAEEIATPENGTVVYQKGMVSHAAPVNLANASAADAWRLDPSASELEAASTELPDESAAAKSEEYVVDQRWLNNTRDGIVDAKLTLRKSDLHAREEDLAFRESGYVRRARLVEAVYELVPSSGLGQKIFAPDSVMLPHQVRRRSRSVLGNIHPLLHATPDLEIHALYLLSQIGADLGGETELHRLPGGPLVVSGIVDSPQRKAALLSQLNSMHEGAAPLRIEVSVAGEPGGPERHHRPESLKVVDPSADAVPADAILRAMLKRQGVPISKLDDAVQTFCQRATQSSSDAREQAWALTTALHLLSPEEIGALSPEGKREWVAVMTRHATALDAALDALRNQLAPLRDASVTTAATTAPTTSTIEDVTTSATQVLALVNAQDAALRSALTLSTEIPAANTPQQFQPPDFWHALDRLLALSASVARTSQTLDAAARSPTVN